jgi:hypothetical protein
MSSEARNTQADGVNSRRHSDGKHAVAAAGGILGYHGSFGLLTVSFQSTE